MTSNLSPKHTPRTGPVIAVNAKCERCGTQHRKHESYTACCNKPYLVVTMTRDPYQPIKPDVVLFVVPPGVPYPKVDVSVSWEWSDPDSG